MNGPKWWENEADTSIVYHYPTLVFYSISHTRLSDWKILVKALILTHINLVSTSCIHYQCSLQIRVRLIFFIISSYYLVINLISLKSIFISKEVFDMDLYIYFDHIFLIPFKGQVQKLKIFFWTLAYIHNNTLYLHHKSSSLHFLTYKLKTYTYLIKNMWTVILTPFRSLGNKWTKYFYTWFRLDFTNDSLHIPDLEISTQF